VFAAPTPLQIGIAAGQRLPDAYYRQLATCYEKRRDVLLGALNESGLRPNRPGGGFFILSDLSGLSYGSGREFCHDLAKDFGVAPIPMDTFYLNQRFGKHLARFTFSVSQEKLEIAAQRLSKFMASEVTSC
jgi:aspartate/methionine/tyrosine aminotransferase